MYLMAKIDMYFQLLVVFYISYIVLTTIISDQSNVEGMVHMLKSYVSIDFESKV